jgi:hypothetical protein
VTDNAVIEPPLAQATDDPPEHLADDPYDIPKAAPFPARRRRKKGSQRKSCRWYQRNRDGKAQVVSWTEAELAHELKVVAAQNNTTMQELITYGIKVAIVDHGGVLPELVEDDDVEPVANTVQDDTDPSLPRAS